MKKPTSGEIKKELRELVAEIAEVEQEKITDDARFVEDLGMDSMMALEILAAIEERYRIQIPEDLLPKLTNLKEAVRLTARIIKGNLP
jgi:acyl carrier protein